MTLLFASVAAGLLLVAVWWFRRHPRDAMRRLVFVLIHVMYRLRLSGCRHIPDHGAAIVICNHVSFMDALVVGGASRRPLRFLMDKPIFDSPWLNWMFRMMGAIPVESERRDPGNVRRALQEVSRALAEGEVVMLFPEGRLTPDGEVQPFRRGLELILAKDPVPVIPAGLSGLWGSWTSHCHGKALSKSPRRFRARVALTFGEPMGPHEVSRVRVEARVRALKAETDDWIATREPLGKARRH